MDRISTATLFDRGISGMLEQQVKLSKTEMQLASGKRIMSPKDDPASAAYLLDLRGTISQVEQYQDNSERAKARLELEETTLKGVGELMPRILELAIQGQNDTNTASDRVAIAMELRQLNDELMTLANTKDSNGEYIFAGFDADTLPFANPVEGTYTYAGDMGSRQLQISATRQVQDRDNGFDIFINVPVWSATQLTSSDAADYTEVVDAGDITIDSGNGMGPIGLGVLPAAASAEERADQLLAAINAVSDQTGVTAEHASPTTLVLISETDRDLTIALTNTATPDNTGLIPGTYSAPVEKRNIFETIHQVITGLESDTPDSTYLNDIHLAQQHVLDYRAAAGSRLNTIDQQLNVNDDFLLTMRTAQSEVEDLDFVEAVSRFQQQLLALQAAQQSFSQVQGLSLFNYL